MSKSLWSRSVWNSLFNRVTGSRRLSRRRSSLRTNWKHGQPIEALEQRIVPAAVAVTYSAGTLTLLSTAGDTNEVVAVKGGVAFTDVTVGGRLTSRLQGVAGNTIDTIVFNGGGGTKDSLAVTGITDGVTVNLTDVDKLQLNITGTTTVTSSITGNGTLTLVTSTISGALEVDHNGAISQSGALIVSGITDIDVTGFDITLKNASNSFGNLLLDGVNITVSESGPTNFGTTTATGILKATSTGAITQTGTVAVTGQATLISNGGNIGTAATPFAGAFTDGLVLTGSVVNVSDTAGNTNLGKVNAASTLKVLSAGAISNSGSQTVSGLATYTAGGGTPNIDLSSSSNNFGSLTLNGANVIVKEKSATDFTSVTATGTFEVISSGAITDSGTIVVALDTTLTTKSNVILFDQAASTFGEGLILTGTTVSVTDSDGATDLDTIIAKGNLNITTTGTGGTNDISQSGSATVTGRATFTATGKDISVNNSSNRFGSIALFGASVVVVEADATNLFTSTITNDLTVTSEGAVTDSGPLSVTDDTTITAGGATSLAITLDADSTFQDVINLDGSNATLVNLNTGINGTTLGDVTLTGSLNLLSSGDVDQNSTDVISVAGQATIEAAAGMSISLGGGTVLDTTTAVFGSLALITSGAGGSVTIREDDGTDLFNSTIGGDLEVDAQGAVTDSGVLEITGNTNIDADDATTSSNITLNSSGSTFEGNVLFDGNNITLVNDTDTDIGATTADGTLLVISNGDINDFGGINTTSLATFNAQGDDITLNDAGLNLDGGVSLFGENVTLTQIITQPLNLATSTIGDDLFLTVDGLITDSGNVVVDDVATITTEVPASQSIELNSARNAFGQLKLTAFNATINEIDETNLGASTLSGFLTVTAVTGVTDSGTVSVTGNANLLASDGDILLNEAASAFGSLTLTADNISVREDNTGTAGTDLFGVSTAGDFTLNAAAVVTQTAGISAGGNATITATGQNITLTQVGDTVTNNFGTLTFTGAAVNIRESSPMSLSPNPANASTATENLTLHSTGSITAPVTGIVSSGEASIVDLKAGATGTEVISLNNAGNTFGELRLQGGTVTINDNNSGANTTIIGVSTVGSLTLTADGDVTRTSGTLAVTNLLSITVTGTNDVNLRTGGTNDFGSINIAADDVTITEASGTIITGLDLTGDLDLISGGNVSGITTTFDIDQTTTIVATNFDITLDATGSADSPTFGDAVNLTGRNIILIGNGALTLGNITATGNGTTTGNATITATGNVTNGTTGKLDVDGVLTINAGTNAVSINLAASNSNLSNELVVNPIATITTTIPTATFTIDNVTADNNISTSEAAGTVSVTGTVTTTGGVDVGDELTLRLVDGTTVTTYTTTVGTGGAFTFTNVSGAELVADDDLTLEIFVTQFGVYAPSATKTYTAIP